MIRRVWITLLAGLLACVGAHASELWERNWIEVETQHFVFISALNEETTIRYAKDLETFRIVVELLTNIGSFEERVPTTVYVFPRLRDDFGFTRAGMSQVAGYFEQGMRANYAAIGETPLGPEDDVLKHEYVHFLVHNRTRLEYPPWYDEGLAELLMTLTAQGDEIDYGKPSRMRIATLNEGAWMPFDALLETRSVWATDPKRRLRFYAQSWLLVHYLTFGRPGRNVSADYQAFQGLVESGSSPVDAFERAFGLRVDHLQKTLAPYARRTSFHRIRLSKPLPDPPVRVHKLPSDQVATQLGLLLIQLGKPSDAKQYFDAALAQNPNNAAALAGAGDVLKFAGQFTEAPQYYEKAIALEPANALHELDYAEYFLTLAQKSKDDSQRESDLIEAHRHFARSYKKDNSNPETLAMNGSSYLFDGESTAKALASLEAAHRMLPSNAAINLLLAKAYIADENDTAARPLLQAVAAWEDQTTADAAQKLLDQLDEPASGGATSGATSAATAREKQ